MWAKASKHFERWSRHNGVIFLHLPMWSKIQMVQPNAYWVHDKWKSTNCCSRNVFWRKPESNLNMFRHLKLQCFIQRTYLRLQNINLIPTIKDVYLSQQQTLLYQAKSNLSVRVAGYGRCCSPGHTAKYGSYTLLEVNYGKIISRQLVQVNLLYV